MQAALGAVAAGPAALAAVAGFGARYATDGTVAPVVQLVVRQIALGDVRPHVLLAPRGQRRDLVQAVLGVPADLGRVGAGRPRLGSQDPRCLPGWLATTARRELRIRSRDLDPGILDTPEALDALRRFATRRGPVRIRILLQSAEAPRRMQAPLIPLAQRLPSVFAFREATDPVDQLDPSAFVVDDARGSWYRAFGHRIEGEARLDAPARARQLREAFDRAWERSRTVTEYRVLGG